MLSAMLSRPTWKEVLENQEDRKAIEGRFRRIDEYTKDFHVCDLWLSVSMHSSVASSSTLP